MKSKGIFLFYGGLPKTIIESQVIAHVNNMRMEGVDIEVWFYCVKRKYFLNSKEHFKKWSVQNIPIKIFWGFRPALPFSELLNALLLNYHLIKEKCNPSYIRCRTEYPASVAGFLKLTRHFRLIWDCRGDSEAEFLQKKTQLKGIKHFFSFMNLFAIRIRSFLASKQSDEAIFVSESLKEMHTKISHSYKSHVIPSVADSRYFFFDSPLRDKMRKQLNFSHYDKVLIYSGSLAIWQCFKETAYLIKKFIKKDHAFKGVILSPDVEGVRKSIQDCPKGRLFCLSVPFTEVNAYLNAADFAFLLREHGPINRVASPVKFAEYCLAGLPIIMTNAVEQSYHLGNLFGNSIYYEFGQKLDLPRPYTDKERYQISERAKRVLSHEAVLDKHLEIYCHRDI